MDSQEARNASGHTGRVSVEVGSTLDDPKHSRDLRVFLSIDDGGWRAFHPLTEDFIISPDGGFVDEAEAH